MGVVKRVKKPTSRKGKKFLVEREPKIIENTKQTLFLQGRKTSDIITKCIKDIYHLKKPDAISTKKNNDILPFEDVTPLERFSKKFDSSLFVFGSHTKKRPNNLVIGRMFDHQVLDMVELGVEEYKGLNEFQTDKIPVGLKPCIIFAGTEFEQDTDMKRLQNLLVDVFQREVVSSVRLQGLEHVIMFTSFEDKLFMRSYRIHLKKSGCSTPRIELSEMGPSIDFRMRRTKLASEDLFKLACKQPKALKPKKVKNVTRDVFGSKLGRVHIKQGNIKKFQTRKMKGLRKTPEEKRAMRQKKKALRQANK